MNKNPFMKNSILTNKGNLMNWIYVFVLSYIDIFRTESSFIREIYVSKWIRIVIRNSKIIKFTM